MPIFSANIVAHSLAKKAAASERNGSRIDLERPGPS